MQVFKWVWLGFRLVLTSLHMIVMWFLDSIKKWTAVCTIWVSLGHRSDLNVEEVGQWIENSFNKLSLFTKIVGDLCLWLYGYICMYFEQMCIDCWYAYWRYNFVTTSESKKKCFFQLEIMLMLLLPLFDTEPDIELVIVDLKVIWLLN